MDTDEVAGLDNKKHNQTFFNQAAASIVKKEKQEEQQSESKSEQEEEVNNKIDDKKEATGGQVSHIIRTQSGRASKPVHKYVMTHHQTHLQSQAIENQKHSNKYAKVIAGTI